MDRRFFLGLLVLVIGVSSTIGCGSGGPKLVKVKGKVNYKGKPVSGAAVNFYFEKGPMANGMTDDQGIFTLTTNGRSGAIPGMALVSVSKIIAPKEGAGGMPAMPKPEDMMKMQKANMGKKNAEGPKNELPEKYAEPGGSKLTADVSTTEENDFEFNLQD